MLRRRQLRASAVSDDAHAVPTCFGQGPERIPQSTDRCCPQPARSERGTARQGAPAVTANADRKAKIRAYMAAHPGMTYGEAARHCDKAKSATTAGPAADETAEHSASQRVRPWNAERATFDAMWSDSTGNDDPRPIARRPRTFTTWKEPQHPETRHPVQRQNGPDPDAHETGQASPHNIQVSVDFYNELVASGVPLELPAVLNRHHDHPLVAWLLGDLNRGRRRHEVNLLGLRPSSRPAPHDPPTQSHPA